MDEYPILTNFVQIMNMTTIHKSKRIKDYYKEFMKNVNEEIKKIEKENPIIGRYLKNKTNFKEIISILPERITAKLSYEIKFSQDISKIYKEYNILEKYILENIEDLIETYNEEKHLVKIMIKIKDILLYPKVKKDITVNKQREEFRKLFSYLFWDETQKKYIVSTLSKKDVRKETSHDISDFESLPIFDFAKRFMKKQATDPIINKKNHIYLVLMLFKKKVRIYVGKAKNGTRTRFGYGSGHLHEVFHYIKNEGKYDLPKQIVDLWTLLLGPSKTLVLTLNTDVTKIDEFEKAMQYYLEFNKKKYGIYGYLHDKIPYKNINDLPIKYKNVYKYIENNQ